MILGIAIPVILIAGGVAYMYSGSDEAAQSQPSQVSQAKQVASKSAKQHSRSAKSSSQAPKTSVATSSSKPTITTADIEGLGFQITPVAFNGEDVNTAMTEGKAPQNTVHDGSQLGYFSTASQARITGISGYMYAGTIDYSIDGGMVAMKNWRIPVKVADGELQTVRWQNTDRDGNRITWELTALPDAEATVEAHKAPAEQADASSDEAVDRHNLSTAQMEHWVRAYIESTEDVDTASDYTFTQKFVDGYAEVYAYQKDAVTGKSELADVYRVNEDGHLQVASDPGSGDWQTASEDYQ